MKNIIVLLAGVLLLQSCSMMKNKQKSRVKEDVHVKTNVRNVVNVDSNVVVKTEGTHSSRETEYLDTNVHVKGTPFGGETELPGVGETRTIVTDGGDITVGRDKKGKLNVSAKPKDKEVPVFVKRTREVFDKHREEVVSNVKKNVVNVSSVDSSRHTNKMVVDKEVKRMGSWWIWVVLILAVVVYVVYKVYCKGVNPMGWFR